MPSLSDVAKWVLGILSNSFCTRSQVACCLSGLNLIITVMNTMPPTKPAHTLLWQRHNQLSLTHNAVNSLAFRTCKKPFSASLFPWTGLRYSSPSPKGEKTSAPKEKQLYFLEVQLSNVSVFTKDLLSRNVWGTAMRKRSCYKEIIEGNLAVRECLGLLGKSCRG